MGPPKDPDLLRRMQEKDGKITHTLLPFILAAPHPLFCGMLCHMSVFYRFYFDPRLMPNGQNQITMRKVCTDIQSLASRLTNNHSSHSQDHEKLHTHLTLIQRNNIVQSATNVEQHELFGIDAGRSFLEVSPKWADLLAVVQVIKSHFFQITAAVKTNRYVCLACLGRKVFEGQHIPCKPPGEYSELFKKTEHDSQF